jgi:hypothetical protein
MSSSQSFLHYDQLKDVHVDEGEGENTGTLQKTKQSRIWVRSKGEDEGVSGDANRHKKKKRRSLRSPQIKIQLLLPCFLIMLSIIHVL